MLNHLNRFQICLLLKNINNNFRKVQGIYTSNQIMSDNFIPLNQSTPIQNRWQQHDKSQQQRFNNRQHGGKWRGGGHNNWNNSRNSSYGSNSSNNSYQERHNIDAYLHPSMLQDPWASLRQYNASRQNSST